MPIASNSLIAAVSLTSERFDESRGSSPFNRLRSRRSSPMMTTVFSERLVVCVSGSVFELPYSTVRKHPDTLLAQPTQLEKFYEPALGMYFFDRNRSVFEYIVQFYQNDGYMEFPTDIPLELVQLELQFFQIGWRTIKSSDFEEEVPMSTFMERGSAFFNDPSSSIHAKIWMFADIFFITISIFTFVIQAEVVYLKVLEKHAFVKDIALSLTILSAIFFTCDLVGRFIFAEQKFRVLYDILTWLDIIAIAPLYFDIYDTLTRERGGVDEGSGHLDNSTVSILRLFRMARVARCLKLIRRSRRLLLIFKILFECKQELSLLLFVWLIGTIVSGSIMFFIEEQSNKEYVSILESCYWAIITIGTIGYGNISPLSGVGMIIATVIIFCSMIFLTVPMTIIIRRFSDSYERFDRSKADLMLFGVDPATTDKATIRRRRLSSTCSNSSNSNSRLLLRNSTKQLTRLNSANSNLK